MTAIQTILTNFHRAGGTVTIEAGSVRVRYPETQRGTIAPILASLRQRKQEVIRVLSCTSGKLSAGKSTLARIVSTDTVAQVPAAELCFHCSGKGECRCAVCEGQDRRWRTIYGQCRACNGTGHLTNSGDSTCQ